MLRERFERADWVFFAVCALVAAVSLFVIFNWFTTAFPEASIDFRYTRDSSARIAEPLLAALHVDIRGMKHAAVFDGDESAKIFLERSLGLPKASAVMRGDVRLWWWHHRWFKPLQEEEFAIDVAPTGEIVSYSDTIPEARALPSPDAAGARRIAEAFLARAGAKLPDLQLVAQSERALPHRLQRIFTYESHSVHPAGAPYRTTVTVDGDRVSSYAQRVKVPDAWSRAYVEMRSKNDLAGLVDLGFLALTMVCIVIVFIIQLLRGNMRLRMAGAVFLATIILVTGNALNSFPQQLAGYQTTSSYAAFLAQVIGGAIIQAVGFGVLLIVIVSSGEVMFRERFPQHVAIPRLWGWRALASKRVFRSFVLGYTLVALFLGYQVAFYLIADKFGAWAPAEVPYDSLLNSAFPWIAILFAGFFPALSEEFMSRAFSIPFFERIFRSRVAAVIVAAFIWGFGHSTYPNQPFFIRGLEVGLAGCLLGVLLFRFGLLPLLIWHFTVDALYTALLLLRSGNRYYIISGALSSLCFTIPMLISIALYIRNKGFIPDGDLSNATLPVAPPPPRAERPRRVVELGPAVVVTRGRAIACVVVVALALALLAVRAPSVDDAIDYRTTKTDAINAARPLLPKGSGWHVAVVPIEGFRSWDRGATREEGGLPVGFDSVAAEYLLQHGMPVPRLVDLMSTRILAASWMVRAYRPLQKEESLVEIDPRTRAVVGFHRYQSETNPGPQLDQPHALAIARQALVQLRHPEPAQRGEGSRPNQSTSSDEILRSAQDDVNAFDVKEALSFQQPKRRDWLFHFEERQPLAAEAHRRISVRVQGDQVSQLTTTIKIPDDVYREQAKETLFSVAFRIARLIAAVLVLGLIIAGFVIAARKQPFPWRRALRWTAVFAVVPLASAAAHWPLSMYRYTTDQEWRTFLGFLVVRQVMVIAFELGMFFLAVAAIEVAYPHALDLVSRSGRARSGRAAVVAALTAIGVVIIYRVLADLLAARFPALISLDNFHVPQSVALTLPSLLGIADALMRAIEVSAAAGLFLYAIRVFRRAKWLPDAIAIALLFLLTFDATPTAKQMPFMIATTIISTLLVWAIVRFILAKNLLAYPMLAAIVGMISGAATLLQNDRPDLIVNGAVMLVAAAALIAWAAIPREPANA